MSRPGVGRVLMIAATFIVVATLVAALWVMESPSKQRDRRIDERRVEQLEAIADALDLWKNSHKRLPASLRELASQPGLSIAIVDPVDGKPYEYQALSGWDYRVCARFATSTAERPNGDNGIHWYEKRWMHPVGHYCFDRKAGGADRSAAAAAAIVSD